MKQRTGKTVLAKEAENLIFPAKPRSACQMGACSPVGEFRVERQSSGEANISSESCFSTA